MTLNITAVSKAYVLQVSDRRLTVVQPDDTITIDTDYANKAVVVSCSDALLAITFTGLGRLGTQGIDRWLVDVIEQNGLCELALSAAGEDCVSAQRMMSPESARSC